MVSSLQEKVASRVAQLNAKVDLEETAVNVFAEVLDLYFSNGRPTFFSRFKDDLLAVFPGILESASIEDSFAITHSFFLFVRTNNTILNDRENQDEINRLIFIPFQKSARCYHTLTQRN